MMYGWPVPYYGIVPLDWEAPNGLLPKEYKCLGCDEVLIDLHDAYVEFEPLGLGRCHVKCLDRALELREEKKR